jgi:hypothetical protein
MLSATKTQLQHLLGMMALLATGGATLMTTKSVNETLSELRVLTPQTQLLKFEGYHIQDEKGHNKR